ncbi:hypothetical protein Fmac_003767 [Flemingia macrophylla]|uniref:Uncharacterized protein n=1 Tax=Flemingia macrophylla TaxID=520843 RepID=A0ABD1N3V7_9FABA
MNAPFFTLIPYKSFDDATRGHVTPRRTNNDESEVISREREGKRNKDMEGES